MKILIMADLHSVRYDTWQEFLTIDKNTFDVIATLGDIHGIYLRQLRDNFPDKRIFGVLGNHDEKGKFSHYDIEDIHGKAIDVNGFKIAGIEGSFKYKDNKKFPLYEQSEINDICMRIEKTDIIISHNSPMGIHDSSDDVGDLAHLGFVGLLEYIKEKSPKYCIHGHQHINKTTNYLGTKVIGIYGGSILDVNTGQIEQIF